MSSTRSRELLLFALFLALLAFFYYRPVEPPSLTPTVNFSASPENTTPPPPLSEHTLHVLFIGNSHTFVNDIPAMVVRLAAEAHEQQPLQAVMVVRGGATLEDHWNEGKALTALKQNRWDYVVLQEQSYRPVGEVEAMFEAGRRFDEVIDALKAQTVIFLGWRRYGLDNLWPQEAWTESNTTLANMLHARLAPVGVAWQEVKKIAPNVLLQQSDGSHATPAGSYLAACVFYSTFYRKSPVGLPYEFAGASLSNKDAEILQRIAWETVQKTEKRLMPPAWPSDTEELYPMGLVYAQEGKKQQASAILKLYSAQMNQKLAREQTVLNEMLDKRQ